MWRNHAMEGRTGDPNSREQPWPCSETLKTLAELNEQCLELLTEQALLRTSAAPPMFRDLVDLWCQLDVTARRRAAACPYLLIDAGFADPCRWRWVGENQVAENRTDERDADANRTHETRLGETRSGETRSGQIRSGQTRTDHTHIGPARSGETRAGQTRVGDRESVAYASFFAGLGAARVAHQVFTSAWYIARIQPLGAPLFLGMPAHCVTLLRACTMRQVMELANQHVGWLRPRWAARVGIWRQLLVAALSGEGLALEMARLHGVQLLAMEVKAMEQVRANEMR